MCICPKECDIIYYKTFMTYASSKLNTENQFDLSARYLNRTGKHLNESLDIKEVILPERRRANIRETKAVLRGLPTDSLLQEMRGSIAEIKRTFLLFADLAEFKFIEATVYEVMQNVLQDDFIDVWEQMDLYSCMAGSSELNKIIRNSFGSNHTETWQSALSLRLEEKMIASNRTLHNLDRVHDAYNNVVPLVNNRVTAEGRYDFLYITSGLFPQTSEINETYIHLRGHLQKYIQNIDALISIYNTNNHNRQTCTQCFNYSRGFREASVEYEIDLRKYESLVIRKPLKRILAEGTRFVYEKNKCHTTLQILWVKYRRLHKMFNIAFDQYAEFKNTHIGNKISEYLADVKTKRLGSKLDLAGELMSDRFTLLVETFINIVSEIEESVSKLASIMELFQYYKSLVIWNVSRTRLFSSFVAKLYDHYNKTTATQKANMNEYFRYIDKTPLSLKYRHFSHSPTFRLTHLTRLIKDLSLRNLRSFKIRLESFLEMTRLDGAYFRYVFLY